MSTLRKIRRRQQMEIKPFVLIVKPHKKEGQTCEETNQFIMKAFQRGIAEYLPVPSKVAELARNYGIHKVLEERPDISHVFFQDDDSPPTNDLAIEQLLYVNKPVVCGVTPIVRTKGDTIYCMWSAITEKDGKKENIGITELPKEPFKVYRTGGTCLLVRREVLMKLKPPYQITTYNENWTDVVLSEDMYFSDKIREAGFEIWCNPNVRCHHFHMVDLLNIFAIYEQCMLTKAA